MLRIFAHFALQRGIGLHVILPNLNSENGEGTGIPSPFFLGWGFYRVRDNWEASVSEYLADLQAGVEEWNNAAPQTEEERQEIFRLKKRVVDTLVKRVTIDKDRELSVEIRLNLLNIIEKEPHSSAVHFGKDGIYTRIFDFYHTGLVIVEL